MLIVKLSGFYIWDGRIYLGDKEEGAHYRVWQDDDTCSVCFHDENDVCRNIANCFCYFGDLSDLIKSDMEEFLGITDVKLEGEWAKHWDFVDVTEREEKARDERARQYREEPKEKGITS